MNMPWIRIAAIGLLIEGCNSTPPTAPDSLPSSEQKQEQRRDDSEKSQTKPAMTRSEAKSTPPLAKQKLTVAADGFPSGHGSPEGVACDLARAFINRDATLFMSTCIALDGDGKGPEDYAAFLKNTAESMKQESLKKEPSPGGPKAIGKVFAARHLSKNGPASYGYAAFSFQDIMFVDVGCFLHNGEHVLNRTMVIKDKDGKWYVDPMPAVSPLLSDGLNDESASTIDFSEANGLEKKQAPTRDGR